MSIKLRKGGRKKREKQIRRIKGRGGEKGGEMGGKWCCGNPRKFCLSREVLLLGILWPCTDQVTWPWDNKKTEWTKISILKRDFQRQTSRETKQKEQKGKSMCICVCEYIYEEEHGSLETDCWRSYLIQIRNWTWSLHLALETVGSSMSSCASMSTTLW